MLAAVYLGEVCGAICVFLLVSYFPLRDIVWFSRLVSSLSGVSGDRSDHFSLLAIIRFVV